MTNKSKPPWSLITLAFAFLGGGLWVVWQGYEAYIGIQEVDFPIIMAINMETDAKNRIVIGLIMSFLAVIGLWRIYEKYK